MKAIIWFADQRKPMTKVYRELKNEFLEFWALDQITYLENQAKKSILQALQERQDEEDRKARKSQNNKESKKNTKK